MDREQHKCNRCDKTFDTEKEFHSHFREHGMRIAEYYQSEFPRYDLYDGDIIKFKSKEFYFNNDFNNKNHLRWWINKQTPEDAKEWCRATLSRRRILKKQIYTPTQVELRSLMVPSGNYLNELFGDYYVICAELGYKNRYYLPDTKVCQHILPTDKRIIVDTREQNPLQLKDYECISKKLNVGDYALEDEEYADKCVIERKSLGDFYSTMSAGNERFRKELDRSVVSEQYVVVLIEAAMDKVSSYKYSRPAFKKIKAEPEFIFHRMRDLIYDYPNLQFLFVDGRGESKRMIKQLFGSRGQLKDVDLQLQYDTGNL
jgi:hypothetical protein